MSSISRDHAYHGDLNKLQERLQFFSVKTEVRREPSHRGEEHHSTSHEPRRDHIKRPTINLPVFHGNIMHWNSFWTAFAGAIHDDPHLSKINKLTYLRGCIKDPNINNDNNEHQYDEVVQQLQQLYDRPKVVHAAYCNKMVETTPIKSTQTDLNSYANEITYVIMGLQTLKQYDIESCYTSLAVQRLPKHIKELWQIECKEDKKVASIDKLVTFIRERAAAAAAGMPVPTLTTNDSPQLTTH